MLKAGNVFLLLVVPVVIRSVLFILETKSMFGLILQDTVMFKQMIL